MSETQDKLNEIKSEIVTIAQGVVDLKKQIADLIAKGTSGSDITLADLQAVDASLDDIVSNIGSVPVPPPTTDPNA